MTAALNSSLSSLLSKTSLDDHQQLLTASENVLKSSKSDEQAQHVKAVALLKLDRYDEAVSFFDACGPSLRERAPVEYAYALYKSGKLAEAVEVASKVKEQRGAQHIEAQARYRLEEPLETAKLYQRLRTQQVSAEDFDLRVNQAAIDGLADWSGATGPGKKPGREDLEAFETAYNAACGSIARGELAQAEILLKRAKELCKHSEDLTDNQKQEELLPILVQQMYVLLRQGKQVEADEIVKDISLDDIVDPATKRVAFNNSLLSSKQQSNPFLVHKLFNSAPSIPETEKLFSYQSTTIISNGKTIDLQSFKFNSLTNSIQERSHKGSPASTESELLLSSAFNAAAHARNEGGKAAINYVLPELERHPRDIGLAITLVQMYILVGNATSAIELLEGLFKRLEESNVESERNERYHPSLVSIMVALYRLQGRKSHVKQELAKAASHWRHKSQPPITLLRAAGISLLQSSTASDLSQASEIFKKLYEEQPNDKATVAGYIASHVLTEPDSVRSLADKLTPVAKLIPKVDINALEAAGIPQSSNALAIAASANRPSRKRANAGGDSNRNKRVRMSRLPKGFDPAATNNKPDPERWLPMRDRSYYRAPKGKKKGRGKGDDRTQGGNVNENLDVSKQTQVRGGEVVSGGGGSGGGKKKKGKGKR